MDNIFEKAPLPLTSKASGKGAFFAPEVYALTVQIVNVCYVGQDPSNWFLVDAGVTKSENDIVEQAERLYGKGCKPKAILLTHGHFDHIGALPELLKIWDVPVYAHAAELPYLTGEQSYPPGDPSVDNGMVSKMSPMFPHDGLDLTGRVQAYNTDGTIPDLPDWRVIHTPGHTPGHVSLFREKDRTLIAGDAFVTVQQESLYKVVTQKQEISGPPKYMTTDWDASRTSVKKLLALRPKTAVTGHGLPMEGSALIEGLENLASHFDEIAVPEKGRFVNK
ncbi:MBL fold metallo-hydrolase [Paenibacillus sambharensis]|uniref:MBL fold metallo-hydrolase n=1 Tax=Paenibacillus sambharensis TaxID=1803190 RepID=A0A2W1LXM0_9BACL|nr:MBL fold metallo-hydrolase [Paenibacillus sambharensis]PZD96257.1 MBL fold metallo-hydrolase [Paenibacillus sambharensis]